MDELKALIMEDDDADADRLASCLRRYATENGTPLDVRRVASAFDFEPERHPADLIFMDIEMPGVDGLSAARHLRELDQQTTLAFVTSLARHAAHGYEVNATDFIVKPIDYETLSIRMPRILREVESRRAKTVTIGTRERTWTLDANDIVCVETIRHDLYYRLAPSASAGEEDPRVRGTIAEAEARLTKVGAYFRTSPACLVNLDHVAAIRENAVRMDDGRTLPLSRSRRPALLNALAARMGAGA